MAGRGFEDRTKRQREREREGDARANRPRVPRVRTYVRIRVCWRGFACSCIDRRLSCASAPPRPPPVAQTPCFCSSFSSGLAGSPPLPAAASPTLWPRGSRQHKFANRVSLSHPSRPGPRATTESTTPSRGMLRCERDPQNGRPLCRAMPCCAVPCRAVPRSTHTHTYPVSAARGGGGRCTVPRPCQRQRTNVVAVNESGLCSLKELRELRPSLKTPLLLLLLLLLRPGFNEPPRPTLTLPNERLSTSTWCNVSRNRHRLPPLRCFFPSFSHFSASILHSGSLIRSHLQASLRFRRIFQNLRLQTQCVGQWFFFFW